MLTVAGTDIPVDVLHRLAFGVELLDARTRLRIGRGIRVEREIEVLRRRHRGLIDPIDPPTGVVPLEWAGSGRFKLRHGRGVGGTADLRVHDVGRRYVPRRFRVHLWSEQEVGQADETPPTGPYIPVPSRILRAHLLPGSAYSVPGGATGVRARVEQGGLPLRWPRVVAVDPADRVVGRAHGDERGEFLLLMPAPGGPLPLGDSFNVRLLVRGAVQPQASDPLDPLSDLPLESVPRSANPPTASDLDSPVLRGEAVPAGYVSSSTVPVIVVDVGRLTHVVTPIQFT